MRFSVTEQAFYPVNLDYGDSLPSDLTDITDEQHLTLLDAINCGSYVFNDNGTLTISSIRPDKYHSWDKFTNTWIITAEATMEQLADAITSAAATQSTLISVAKNTISVWQTELLLGTINDEDKALLTTWISYIKAAQAVDTSKPSKIIWPLVPAH